MELPANHILIRKDVKHARLRVSEDGKVRVILPNSFNQEDLNALLSKKKHWIEKNLRYFNEKSQIKLQRNQILLYGNRYSYFYDSAVHKVLIDHDHLSIRSNKNLLEDSTQLNWYKGIARRHLILRTEELAEKLGFTYNQIFIRSQRTKWGNCSSNKNISYNWRIIKAPLFVIDYLIVHELVHTVIMSHTNKFWVLLKSYYPNYREAISWLDKYGNSL
ncbi:M48 family metallopeptidase [Adhaeribacter soli]|uniref:M48 family metallopeptidase n=1 Tax=Adhaeribacter soli TaxID=2607655 RepID=A0A5N1ITC1_9BACT|nr:SprT family zinc-dependent metalloprotease [Adhaeribacter soli]KAA9331149.1 M48 family metallopeptidase [Adhaeribacter soli]